MTAVRFPIVGAQRQDVSGCTSLEKTKQRYLIPILPTYPKYSYTFSGYLSLGSLQLPLLSYTRVVEWVLGRPLELYPAGKVLYGLMLDRPISELGIMVMLLGVIRGMSSGEWRWLREYSILGEM